MKNFSFNNHKILKTIFVLLIFSIGVKNCVIPHLGLDFSKIPGDLADGRLNNYFLEHGYRYLKGDIDSFWHSPFFYPEKYAGAYSDNHIGSIPIYSFFRLLGSTPETSYQLWICLGFILNFIFSFIVLLKLVSCSYSSSLGAYIYTFSMPVLTQLIHAQLHYRFLFPLALYLFLKFLAHNDLKYLLFSIFIGILQTFFAVYLGYFTFFILGIVFFVGTFFYGGVKRYKSLLMGKQNLTYITTALGINISLLIFLFWPYFKISKIVGERSWPEIQSLLPKVLSYFYASYNSVYWGFLSDLRNNFSAFTEHRLFIGAIPLLALFITSVVLIKSWRKTNSQTKTIFFSFLLIIIVTTDFFGFSFYRFFTFLPGVKAIRAVSRIHQFLVFFYGFFIAYLSMRYLKKKYLIGILAFFLILDQKMTPDTFFKNDSLLRIQKLEAQMANYNQDSILVVIHGNLPNGLYFDVDAMLLAQKLNIKTINGYSGFVPPWYQELGDQKDLDQILLRLGPDKKEKIERNIIVLKGYN